MPWRAPTYEGEFPSLGWGVVDFLEETLVNPDGANRGEPWRFTDEQIRFIVKLYRIDPFSGRLLYRRGVLVRPKGWGKSPVLAALAIAEAVGPVRFDYWDEAGEPVGKPADTPYVQIAAVSEDQTDNTYSLLIEMLELGTVGDYAPGMDVGLTRTNFPHNGGKVEPVTASSGAREGQRITFAVLDETHLWTPSNGGVKLAATLRRNLAKMSGISVETTNAPKPGEDSVAESTLEAGSRGGQHSAGLLIDHREGLRVADLTNEERLRQSLKRAYGDAHWIDLDRIVAEIADPATNPEDARRFYLNQIVPGGTEAFDTEQWGTLEDATRRIPDRSLIVLGFDGSRFDDSTAIVACDIISGHLWPLAVWGKPSDVRDGEWEVPEDEVDAVLEDAFKRYRVWRIYADPAYWESALARWSSRFGENKVVAWYTHRPRQMANGVRAFDSAIRGSDLSHNGDQTLTRHVSNARRRDLTIRDDDGWPMWVIKKDRAKSPRKIDACMAAILAWIARMDAIAAGVGRRYYTYTA